MRDETKCLHAGYHPHNGNLRRIGQSVPSLRRLGIECIYVSANATDEEIHRAFRPDTKAVFDETIANPAVTVLDIERFDAIAHAHGVLLIVDNTFASPGRTAARL